MKTLLTLASVSILLLSGCGSETSTPLLYQVKAQPFVVEVDAKGELFAAQATIISAPVSTQGMQTLAWLAPEFSYVKKGDVIARFDGESMQLQHRNRSNQLAMNEQDILAKKGSLEKALHEINQDIGMVGQEFEFAEKFTIDDIRIRSKLEILDQMQNTEYLSSKKGYLNWKNDSFSESSKGDIGLLEMKQQQFQSKIKQLDSSLSRLEVTAPHDGMLVYKANWRGEKPKAGQTAWPGQKLAELPDISEMKVKLFVREKEAINLVKGKSVSFSLNAYSEKQHSGKIESVAQFPKSINRGDPQKFYETIVTIDKQDSELFMPGRKLKATIFIAKASEKLIVPLQSVFTEQDKSYVYLYKNNVFVEQEVKLGQPSLSHVEVLSGLSKNQKISLTDQEQG